MSHHNHEEHHDDGHHEDVPAHATEIVPEKSPEDLTLFALIVACGLFLMAGLGSWMSIEKPSGGGHGHGSEHVEAGGPVEEAEHSR